MATKLATRRLQKEFQAMQKSPSPFIVARFEEKNILDWHFIIRGPPDSPYAGGEYHGLIMFPNEYPFKPPDIKLYTPSGRFETNTKICMSMTSYHPSTWNAAWSVATILTGLLSFMLSDEITTGAVKTSTAEKQRFAAASHGFNLSNKKFKDIFPEYATPEMTDLPDMGNGPTTTTGKTGTDQTEPDATSSSSSGSEIQRADPSTGGSIVAPSLGSAGVADGTGTGFATMIAATTTATTTIAPTTTTTATMTTTPAGTIQQQRRENWFSRWRWVLAALAVIVLGRISSF